MPQHGGHRVNNVEEGEVVDLIDNVEDVQTSLMIVKGRLLKGGVDPGCKEDCLVCSETTNGCDQLKAGIQRLIDEGCLQFSRAVKENGAVSTVTIYFKPSEGRGRGSVSAPTTSNTPVTIPAPVTIRAPTTIVAPGRRQVENSKAVPWRYDNAYRNDRRAGNQIRPASQAPVIISTPVRTPAVASPVVDNIDPPEVIAYYLEDLYRQGVDITEFQVDWLPEFPPYFQKRTREPSEKTKQAKKAKLGETFGSRPSVPLVGSLGKSISLPPSVKIKPIASTLPQTNPIYTTADTPPSTTRSSNLPSQKFNLATTTLPVSEAEMLNETTSPSSSPSPQSPPYYNLSSDTEPSDLHSPTLAQLQDRVVAFQNPSHSKLEPEVTSPPLENPNTTTSEPPPSEPTHSEPQPSEPIHSESQPYEPPHSEIPQPITSADPTTPTLNLRAPTSPSQASANEPETTLLTLEEAITRIREAEAKALADVATAEAEAKAKADAEEAVRLAEESAAKARANELTQGESSNAGFIPLVLKTLEEL
ncbi:leucine-rich repeat extensin-like protein 5 [Lathyrus oleraceus]|uniref:leucine-rich repeat extensin-like protein 5 n=1 Tax=Pisum sativum TaxID=3888 RepID=UPI0021CF3632|nr:leucine-rich repeat extensin-like protein 5 [Pisum sativum]